MTVFQLSFSSNHCKGIFQTNLSCHLTGCTPTVFSWLSLKKLTPQELVVTQAGWLPQPEKLLWLVWGKVSLALKLIHQMLFSIRNVCVFSLMSFSNMHSWLRAVFFKSFALWTHLAVLACTICSCKSGETITEMSHAHIIKEELVSNAELTEPLYITGWVSWETIEFRHQGRPSVPVIMLRSSNNNFQQSNRKGQWVRWTLPLMLWSHKGLHKSCFVYLGIGFPMGVNGTVHFTLNPFIYLFAQ